MFTKAWSGCQETLPLPGESCRCRKSSIRTLLPTERTTWKSNRTTFRMTRGVCCDKAARLSRVATHGSKNKRGKKRRVVSHRLASALNLTNHYEIPEDHCNPQQPNKGSALPEILPSIFHFSLQNWILRNNVWHLPSFPVGETSKHQYRSSHSSQKKKK